MVQKQDLLRNNERVGFSLYDEKLPTALRTTQADARKESFVVASMPELLVLRRQVPFSDRIWNRGYTCNSEEDVGTTPQGNKVVIAVHGGGILTPDRIETAYERGLTKQYAAHLAEYEIQALLQGKLADETQIPVCQFSDFKRGIKDLPRQYAVVMDFAEAQKAASGDLPVESLRDNASVIVRAGGVAEANAFVDKVAQRYTHYGNWHPFNAINAGETQGRVLFVGSLEYGLIGDFSLNYDGRFVGVRAEQSSAVHGIGDSVVAPEARVGRSADAKKSPLEGMVSLQLPREFVAGLEAGAETITYKGRTYNLKQ